MHHAIELSVLASSFKGILLREGDKGYEEARKTWNAMVDHKPAVIARCTDTSDVICALGFGREHGLEISVRCGGHSIVGHSVTEGGLMIDLSPMNNVQVDPLHRLASVQGGALLGTLDNEAQKFGLATTAGNVSHTGVGGLTLAGGMGWLARQYGLACDNVMAFDVVTADGMLLHASDAENPDLYWGLRGGGGNFGVVTNFEFRLHPLDDQALTVELFYSLEAAGEALQRWREFIHTVPREATPTAWTGNARPDSFLPAEFHNQRIASIGYDWVGDPGEGLKLIPSLRGNSRPIAERIRSMTYIELQKVDDDTRHEHRVRRYWKGYYLPELPDEAVRAYLTGEKHYPPADEEAAWLPSADFQVYGGAIRDLPDDATAFSHRDTLVECVVRTRWIDPAEDAARMEITRLYAKALEPYASGVYIHTLAEGDHREIERGFSRQKLARLTTLKDRYDPQNIFHLNQNIKPSSQRPTESLEKSDVSLDVRTGKEQRNFSPGSHPGSEA